MLKGSEQEKYLDKELAESGDWWKPIGKVQRKSPVSRRLNHNRFCNVEQQLNAKYLVQNL
jgi:hypothetical protein